MCLWAYAVSHAPRAPNDLPAADDQSGRWTITCDAEDQAEIAP